MITLQTVTERNLNEGTFWKDNLITISWRFNTCVSSKVSLNVKSDQKCNKPNNLYGNQYHEIFVTASAGLAWLALLEQIHQTP